MCYGGLVFGNECAVHVEELRRVGYLGDVCAGGFEAIHGESGGAMRRRLKEREVEMDALKWCCEVFRDDDKEVGE